MDRIRIGSVADPYPDPTPGATFTSPFWGHVECLWGRQSGNVGRFEASGRFLSVTDSQGMLVQAGGRSGQIRARDFERVPAKNRTSFCGRPRARLQLWPRGAWGASVNQRTRCALFPSISFQIPKQTQTAPLSASARPGQAVGRSPPAPPPVRFAAAP